jgi:hypothetical protein
MKDPQMLILNMFCFAKYIQNLDKNCNTEDQLAFMISRYINPNLLFTTNPDGKLTLPDIGFIKPWNGHSGVTITNVQNYNSKMIEIILFLLNAGQKVRIVKNIADDFFFKKYKDIIHINKRYFFFTHMLQMVKKN